MSLLELVVGALLVHRLLHRLVLLLLLLLLLMVVVVVVVVLLPVRLLKLHLGVRLGVRLGRRDGAGGFSFRGACRGGRRRRSRGCWRSARRVVGLPHTFGLRRGCLS